MRALTKTIAQLLHYSLSPTQYKFKGLTATEQLIAGSQETLDEVKAFVQREMTAPTAPALPAGQTSSVTIGYIREDGDIDVLATMNNMDGLLDADVFDGMVEAVRQGIELELTGDYNLEVFYREDTPQTVTP